MADAQALHDKTLDETALLVEQFAREFAAVGELPGNVLRPESARTDRVTP